MRYEFNPTARPKKKMIEIKTWIVLAHELGEEDFRHDFNTEQEALDFIAKNEYPEDLCYYEHVKRIWR